MVARYSTALLTSLQLRRGQRRGLRRLAAVIGAAALGAATLLVGSTGARAAACQTSGPVAGSYTVTVCIGTPADGATATGQVGVTATASATGTSPGIQRMVFYLDGQYVLTDYTAPYTFTLPSARFVDGAKTLEAEALMRDGFVSSRASISLTFQNGVSSPPPPATGFTPTSGTTPAAGHPFVVAAAGDGAGGEPSAANVTSLIASWNPNLFLYLGDVYEKGTESEFTNWYAPSTYFGQFNAITDPTVGNHEYSMGQAPGYFNYWKSPAHYYSFNAGGWHIVSLDSNSQLNEFAPGTGQYQWLQSDLAASNAACTLVYFHHPLYDIGPEGSASRMSDIWSLMAANGVDVVLNGHDHDYQRWTRLDGAGNPSPTGIVEFVAGGGGHGIEQFQTTDSRVAVGYDSSPQAFGALRMTLGTQGAGFQYVNTAGVTLDSGSIPCSGAPSDTTPPATPTGLTATPSGSHQVALSWSEPIDNVGVTGYDIYRNGVVVATTGPKTTYTDVTVAAELTYSYQVKARDAAGNVSAASTTATVTTPPGETGILADGFESGSLSSWTSIGVVPTTTQVFSGSYAARATSTGPATWAWRTLPGGTYADLYYRIRFKVIGSLSTNTSLMKFRTSTGTSLLGYYLTNTGRLSYRNDIAGAATSSMTTIVTTGQWHTLQAHITVNGTSGQIETWYDDTKIMTLTKPESLGTTPVGRIQIGENSADRVYDVAFDTVLVDTSFILTDTMAPSQPTGATATPSSATQVSFSWAAASDNVGVTGYSVYRDGVFLAGLPASTLSYTDTGLDPSSQHTYTVDAFDMAGNHSPQSAPAITSTLPDTTPPSTPTGLAVNGISQTEVDLSWPASTDDIGVAGYDVYRDGTLIGTVENGVQGYVDGTVAQSTTYAYTVDAFDAEGNHSSPSSPLPVTTPGPPDTSPPSTPTGLGATTVSSTEIDLAWSASTDDVGVTGYTIYRNGSQLTTVNGTTLAYNDTVAPNGSYTYTVDAFDAAGNHSGQSDPATASTNGDASPPTKPAGLGANATGPTTVNLSWSASTDNVGVTGYTIYRNGTQLTTVGGSTLTYSDTTTSGSTAYTYTVDAFDAAGNHSTPSDPASLTTPPPYLFSDGFESGMGNWTVAGNVVAQQQLVDTGSWAARATSTGPAAWAWRTIASQSSVYFRIRFWIVSQSTNANLIKFRTGTGTSLLGVYVGSNGKLSYRNDIAGQSTSSGTKVTTGQWHTLEMHVVVNGAAGMTETWYDGVKISQLSNPESLGTTAVGRVQIGENSADRIYDIAFDTVVVDTSFIS